MLKNDQKRSKNDKKCLKRIKKDQKIRSKKFQKN